MGDEITAGGFTQADFEREMIAAQADEPVSEGMTQADIDGMKREFDEHSARRKKALKVYLQLVMEAHPTIKKIEIHCVLYDSDPSNVDTRMHLRAELDDGAVYEHEDLMSVESGGEYEVNDDLFEKTLTELYGVEVEVTDFAMRVSEIVPVDGWIGYVRGAEGLIEG